MCWLQDECCQRMMYLGLFKICLFFSCSRSIITGQYKEAQRHFQEALDGRLDVLGKRNIDTLYSTKGLALCLQKQGN